ncbi:MAG TPA: cell envelope integrity protein TolA [Thermomonas sp.]|uniref:TonB C-terminal domain-containing protein n=1 Tax=Thermomonas sp. TaxID=1971895 RepID=UPI001B50D28E|nr:cell envelope integrity protein TolA [Burkholderiales bacterium]HNV79841.1 cell envelope integrity protein TolA [Thermomonas sp.]HOZ23834.1 cell envelope integrity protein TolA [Thermomonas sp.]HPM56384.1 cell envelope integrity protein TolA [Thermomonas sp.]HPW13644.1 cell envelope integrity protein TolA [Thermomonas sp.]
MKESRTDNNVALLQALGLHVALFALMFAGLHWTRSPIAEAAHGDVIEADLVSVSDLSASMQRALRRDPEPLPQPIVEPDPLPPDPEPLPEPVVEPPVEELPPPEPDPAPVEQERVQRDADSAQVAKVDQEQEEKRKKPDQAELDARRRLEALAEIRRQRALAAQERTMAEQKAQQLNDARNSSATPSRPPPPGNPDSRLAESAGYQVALMNAILRQWTRPESVKLGQVCQVLIRQIPGGEVVSVEISPSCPYDEQGRRSVEAAILKASPLPYAGYEAVFVRNPVLKFRAEDL